MTSNSFKLRKLHRDTATHTHRVRLYKAGKTWVAMGATFVTLGLATLSTAGTAQAETVETPTTQVQATPDTSSSAPVQESASDEGTTTATATNESAAPAVSDEVVDHTTSAGIVKTPDVDLNSSDPSTISPLRNRPEEDKTDAQVTVKYVDDKGKTLVSDSSGQFASTNLNSTVADNIEALKDKGYTVVSDKYDDDITTYNIPDKTLQEAIDTYTADVQASIADYNADHPETPLTLISTDGGKSDDYLASALIVDNDGNRVYNLYYDIQISDTTVKNSEDNFPTLDAVLNDLRGTSGYEGINDILNINNYVTMVSFFGPDMNDTSKSLALNGVSNYGYINGKTYTLKFKMTPGLVPDETQSLVTLTTNYLDENGNPIQAAVITSGMPGVAFTDQAPTITGYTLANPTKNTVNGTYTGDAMTVDFVYQKAAAPSGVGTVTTTPTPTNTTTTPTPVSETTETTQNVTPAPQETTTYETVPTEELEVETTNTGETGQNRTSIHQASIRTSTIGSTSAKATATPTKANVTAPSQADATLPQTSDAHSSKVAQVIGVTLLAAVSLIGLTTLAKKKRG